MEKTMGELRATMIAQADAAKDDRTKLFAMAAYCNRYSRQPAATYTGPKLKDGTPVPQSLYIEIEQYVDSLRGA